MLHNPMLVVFLLGLSMLSAIIIYHFWDLISNEISADVNVIKEDVQHLHIKLVQAEDKIINSINDKLIGKK